MEELLNEILSKQNELMLRIIKLSKKADEILSTINP